MTLIAGVFSRNNQAVDRGIWETLKTRISRNQSDRREVVEEDRFCMVKVDLGNFGESGTYCDRAVGSISFLSGQPLLKTSLHCEGQSRSADLELLHRDLDRSSWEHLRCATGIFSIAHYRPDPGRLTLVTDKMGHRCVYYWVDSRQVIFSSTLRLLEALPLPRSMDVLALVEMSIYPRHTLNIRTPYYEIKRMHPAQTLTFEGSAIRTGTFFDFGAIPQSSAPEEVLLGEAHERFMNGVRRRARPDTTVGACLSGGLDSRAVVCALRALGKRVYTSTFYPVYNSQDRVYAAMMSRVAGTIHGEVQVLAWVDGRTFESTMQETINKSLQENSDSLSRQMLWTGDGGSVSTGHLHIEEDLAQLMRDGKLKDAFLSYHKGTLRGRLIDKQVASKIAALMYKAFVEEMRTISSEDRARAFHVFLLKNHQRKDFVQHFESIDLHRLELQTPFYDSDYLETIVSTPFDLTVAHRFYHKWLRLFPHATAVPWQTYAGHEPCPLPPSAGVMSQWDAGIMSAVNAVKRKATLKAAARVFWDRDFPKPLVNRNLFRVAYLLHCLGGRDCEAALKMALVFCEYWKKSQGRFVVPASLADAEVRATERLNQVPQTSFAPECSSASVPV